jgi:hypothetical protein
MWISHSGELAECLARVLRIGHDEAFSYLQAQSLGLECRLEQYRADADSQVGQLELTSREIHRYAKGTEAFPAPANRFGAGRTQHPFAQADNGSRLFGKLDETAGCKQPRACFRRRIVRKS